MIIMILGATGFVGTHLTRKLLDQGHEILAVVRTIETGQALFPSASLIECDFTAQQNLEEWMLRMKNVDVVINCIGIFYHRNPSIVWQIHFNSPRVIFEAASKAGVKKIIQLSALAVEHYESEYAKSKLELDNYLLTLPVQSLIFRPSFIYGPGSEGGMALLMTMASFPVIPLPEKGEQLLQPIHIDTLCTAISNMASLPPGPSYVLTAVSPTAIALKTVLGSLRHWLQLPKSFFVQVPMILIKIMAWFGNFSSSSKINSPAINMLSSNKTASAGETAVFYQLTGVNPESFKEGLEKKPSTDGDRWQALLGWLRPFLRLSLAFMWFASALTSAFFAQETSYLILKQAGVPDTLQSLLLFGASFINFMLGIGLLFNFRTRSNCMVQLLIIVIYTLIISVQLPYYWLEPFGSVVKNIPIMVAILILYFTEPVSSAH
ncbi:oxidoreductase [Legionella quinlivanii]|uniref:Oxidoreductase n=1 Tax=Legionella quinlivanii TaxID=45073 RepID=A0A0W0Y068_9GAMM|nr:SDR family oxidoreductase [Legionella quinlivanii]KTD49972.1 oxidoreductase [Legionella quinlivanii]SEF96062.1 Nucleoside-diphosphate-sugar epimerase [Legionella quinlivanii DSM 21216]STY11252.1 oxidoreductase [Legionella quinlivanii]